MNRRDFIGTIAALPFLSHALYANKNKIKKNVKYKPNALKKGSKVGIVAPGSAVSSPADIKKAEEALAYFGLIPVWGKHVSNGTGYKTRSAEERIEDFNSFIRNPEIDAIMSVRGGYGSCYLLDSIDYKAFSESPKLLIGYSDITALLIAIYQKTGICTYHGPVLLSDFSTLTADSFQRVTFGGSDNFRLSNPETLDGIRKEHPCRTLFPGISKGKLIGGNLSIISSLMGTPYEIETDDHILFLEDVGESPYRIDRMLMQLKLAGKFDKIRGLVWGKCEDCDSGETLATWDSDLAEVLDRIFKPLGVPCFSGLLIGHTGNQFTLPLGIEAEIDAGKQTLTLLENAVGV